MSWYRVITKSVDNMDIQGPNDQIPSRLYKFISLNDNEKGNNSKFTTLMNNQVWLSSISEFNDPYECKSMYIDGEWFDNSDFDLAIKRTGKTLLQSIGEDVAILSLSGNGFDSLPMWAYYTNNYMGFCVEYEVVDPQFLFKVNYSERRIEATSSLALFMNYLIGIFEGEKEENDAFRENATLLSTQLYRKHESWKHEKEYRAIAMVDNVEKGIPVPAEEVGLKIKRIVAGINCKPEHLERLQEISDALSCGKVLQARTSKDKFTLFEEA